MSHLAHIHSIRTRRDPGAVAAPAGLPGWAFLPGLTVLVGAAWTAFGRGALADVGVA